MPFRSSEAVFFGCFETLFRVPSGVYVKTGSGSYNDGLKRQERLGSGRYHQVHVGTDGSFMMAA